MPTPRIKICGIKDATAAKAAVKAGADYIGLVFVEKSPRYVTVAQAQAAALAVEDRIETVGLFVDREAQEIKHIAGRVGLSIVQLHGHEKIGILDKLDGLSVWKALPFTDTLLQDAQPWDEDPRVDALLIDTPTTGELTGGSGVAFDWQALAKVISALSSPVILAGGLNPQNVGDAIRTVRPWAVDVSSGVESSLGVKDSKAIKTFCDAVRQKDSN